MLVKYRAWAAWDHVVASPFSPFDLNVALSWKNLSVHHCNQISAKNPNNFTQAGFQTAVGKSVCLWLAGLNIAIVIELTNFVLCLSPHTILQNGK